MLARQCAKHAAGTQDDTNLPANQAQTNAPTNAVSFEHCTRHEPRAPSRSNRSAPVRLQHTFLASSREQPAVRPIEPGRGPLELADCRPTPTMSDTKPSAPVRLQHTFLASSREQPAVPVEMFLRLQPVDSRLGEPLFRPDTTRVQVCSALYDLCETRVQVRLSRTGLRNPS